MRILILSDECLFGAFAEGENSFLMFICKRSTSTLDAA